MSVELVAENPAPTPPHKGEGLSCRARRISHTLIPVLVTGIQPPRVGAVKDSCDVKGSPASKDLDALDSCDKHGNEGVPVGPLHASGRRP
ncbi:hypothetical protein EHI48_09365 [Rhizobium sp. WSM1325]|nr:hypothetical protein EHI43_26925 [Rhizobium leguminosarum]RWY80334.1 hypothetical protein EHI48_09365 [Rhizobium leguminosarum]